MSPFTAKQMQVPDVPQFALKDETSMAVLIPHAGSVRVPVGYVRDVAVVETGTVVVILLSFVYLLWTIGRASCAQPWLWRCPRQEKTVRFPV